MVLEYAHLHDWAIFGINVGQYSNTMKHLGKISSSQHRREIIGLMKSQVNGRKKAKKCQSQTQHNTEFLHQDPGARYGPMSTHHVTQLGTPDCFRRGWHWRLLLSRAGGGGCMHYEAIWNNHGSGKMLQVISCKMIYTVETEWYTSVVFSGGVSLHKLPRPPKAPPPPDT